MEERLFDTGVTKHTAAGPEDRLDGSLLHAQHQAHLTSPSWNTTITVLLCDWQIKTNQIGIFGIFLRFPKLFV